MIHFNLAEPAPEASDIRLLNLEEELFAVCISWSVVQYTLCCVRMRAGARTCYLSIHAHAHTTAHVQPLVAV